MSATIQVLLGLDLWLRWIGENVGCRVALDWWVSCCRGRWIGGGAGFGMGIGGYRGWGLVGLENYLWGQRFEGQVIWERAVFLREI